MSGSFRLLKRSRAGRLFASPLRLHPAKKSIASFGGRGAVAAKTLPRIIASDIASSSSSSSSSPLTISTTAALGFAALTLVSTTFFERNRALCENASPEQRAADDETKQLETTTASDTTKLRPDNPLWPKGVTEDDVNELVEECLRDPSVNVLAVPDYIERQIYRSTITLTLNAMYQTLSEFHGEQILGHELRLERGPNTSSDHRLSLQLSKVRVEEAMLEQVADRLLKNKAVNQPLIPDVVERQLYINCLKIMFRVMDLLTTSFRLTVCGHDLRFHMEPSTPYAIQEAAFTRASSSLTEIDMEVMKEIAREAGVDEMGQNRGFLERFFHPSNNEFVAQLHASLYGLVLGVMDDLLANTELELLSDRITFDIVPCGSPTPGAECLSENEKPPAEFADDDSSASISGRSSSTRALPVLTFSIGVGVGMALMALFGRD